MISGDEVKSGDQVKSCKSRWSGEIRLRSIEVTVSDQVRWSMIFGLGNFLWDDIGILGKSQEASMWKPQVSIKSQTGVMAKPNQTLRNLLKIVIFGIFVRWYKNIREVTRVIHAKTPCLYQVPELRYPCHRCRPCRRCRWRCWCCWRRWRRWRLNKSYWSIAMEKYLFLFQALKCIH